MNSEYVLILITAANKAEAEQIGQSLVEEKLIACCNIITPVDSIFFWQGELCREQEAMLVIKSVSKNIDDIISRVKELHSYDTPEIIALPIIAGSEDYLNWVKTETTSS